MTIINYEKHYKMEPGTATIGHVKRYSAGIQGWYEDTNHTTDEKKNLAIINYEKHYKMEPGTATIGDVKRSSAGIQGWYEDTN